MTVALQAAALQTAQIPEQPFKMRLPHRQDSLLLAAVPTALSCAYSFVLITLGNWQANDLRDNTSVLVHEMVSSAVEQADPEKHSLIRINLHDYIRFLVIEVYDETVEPPPQLKDGYTGDAPLLAALEQRSWRWGARPTPQGKLVWAEPLVASAVTEVGLPKRRPTPTPYPRQSPEPPHDNELLQRIVDGLEKW